MGDSPVSRHEAGMIAASETASGNSEAAPPGGWAGIGDVLVILGIVLVAWVFTGDFAGADLMVTYGVAPAVVPRAILIVIAGLAVLLLIQELAQPLRRPRLRLHPRIGAVVFALAVLALYAASFEVLGAFTLMPLFCVAVSLAFVRRSIWKLLAYGVAVSLVTWVLFVQLLGAPLPGSRLPFL